MELRDFQAIAGMSEAEGVYLYARQISVVGIWEIENFYHVIKQRHFVGIVAAHLLRKHVCENRVGGGGSKSRNLF